ncbi:YheC/YheD family protein [Bacillus kwashiorkori]|uniref:YheC/YheD family endospore coat-associated protein n=1 Tax=Bacillus kwashiorkori TaxID=1522318 RepID=UPI000780FA81|nr:YheC/YheD family protein [Bacillus kwashiorkori]
MHTFGIITMDRDAEKEYITELGKRAPFHQFICHVFSPKDILPNKSTINGYVFDSTNNDWKESEFPLPNILYDRCFYKNEQEMKRYSPIINWLKQRKDACFLGYGLPNKFIMYDCLKHNQLLAPYLPPTKQVISASQVLKQLSIDYPIILKPVFGSQGRGIYVLQKALDGIQIKTVKNNQLIEKTLTISQTEKLISKMISLHKYLFQPFLKLQTTEKRPYDIRVFLQKDGKGNWVERGKGIRMGKGNYPISNLASGGVCLPFEKWLATFQKERATFIATEIQELIQSLPSMLETIFHPFFEIGIDISIDQKGAIWILEINSKPGRNVLFHLYPEMKDKLYDAPFQYGNHLLTLSSGGQENCEEKSISNRTI